MCSFLLFCHNNSLWFHYRVAHHEWALLPIGFFYSFYSTNFTTKLETIQFRGSSSSTSVLLCWDFLYPDILLASFTGCSLTFLEIHAPGSGPVLSAPSGKQTDGALPAFDTNQVRSGCGGKKKQLMDWKWVWEALSPIASCKELNQQPVWDFVQLEALQTSNSLS